MISINKLFVYLLLRLACSRLEIFVEQRFSHFRFFFENRFGTTKWQHLFNRFVYTLLFLSRDKFPSSTLICNHFRKRDLTFTLPVAYQMKHKYSPSLLNWCTKLMVEELFTYLVPNTNALRVVFLCQIKRYLLNSKNCMPDPHTSKSVELWRRESLLHSISQLLPPVAIFNIFKITKLNNNRQNTKNCCNIPNRLHMTGEKCIFK